MSLVRPPLAPLSEYFLILTYLLLILEVVNIIPYMPEMTKEKYAKHFWPHIESEYSPSRFYGRSAVKDGR